MISKIVRNNGNFYVFRMINTKEKCRTHWPGTL